MSKLQELKDEGSYWKNQVSKVVQISSEYGFNCFGEEFWLHQPAGVVSLIVRMQKTIDHGEVILPTDPNKA